MAIRHIVEAGLGGSFRDLLIEEADVVSAWPLAEMVSTRAKDIANGRNHGTWAGTGTTRGLSLGDVLPEGGLWPEFDGNGYVEVADDGTGYRLLNESGQRNLSLSGGDMDIVALVKLSASYAAKVRSLSPTGYWRMGEASGALADSSGAGNSLTLTGAATYGSDGAIADGDDAVTLATGADNYFASTAAGLRTDNISFAVWVRPTATSVASGLAYIGGAGGTGSHGYALWAEAGKVTWKIGEGSDERITTDAVVLAASTWSFLVGTYDGTTMRLYVNGVEVKNGTTASGNITYTGITSFVVGNLTGGSTTRNWDGRCDEAAVYSSAVAATDIAALYALRTATDSDQHATLRAIVQKQETNSSGNGWHVAEKYGQARFYLEVAGVVIFNFARGFLADGAVHILHAHYDTVNGLARILIDGVASGADVTGLGTEPALTAADLRIGMFNDDAGGFVGRIGYVMVGRQGNAGLSATLQATRAWTDISDDVAGVPMVASHGLSGRDPGSRIARPGSMGFSLLSSAEGSRPLGYYTPGHANARSGWRERVPIRWTATDDDAISEVRFRGFVQAIVPDAGVSRNRQVAVSATTWLGVAMTSPIQSIPVQINVGSGDVFARVIDEATRPPIAVDIAEGDSVFPFALDDTKNTNLLSAAARVVLSEGGLAYEREDGTLVFESRTDNLLSITADDAFTGDELVDLDGARDVQDILNQIDLTLTPRVPSGSAVTLADMPDRIAVAPGETVPLDLAYIDPAQKAATVGGQDIITPAATTDYTMNAAEDGLGADLTSDVSLMLSAEDKGGGGVKLFVTNTGATAGWFKTKVRGTALYTYESSTIPVPDAASIRRNDLRPFPLDLGYQTDASEAQSIARLLLAVYSTPVMVPGVAQLISDPANEARVLERGMGDMVTVEEDMLAVDDQFRIIGCQVTAEIGGVMRGEYTFRKSLAGQFWIVGEAGYSEVGETTVVA